VISEALGEAHTKRQPMKLTEKGSGSKYGDNAYVAPRLRGSTAAAGGSSGGGSSRWRLGEGSRRGREKGTVNKGRRKKYGCRRAGSRWSGHRRVGSRRQPRQHPLHTPCHAFIHLRSIADPWTAADPWTEWHRTDMTMYIAGKMPGDKTERALEPPAQNSQGETRNTTPQATCRNSTRWVVPLPAGF
jgi:hypothetical protein